MQHDQESRTVSLLRDQVRKLQKELKFLEDSKIFQDPDSPSSSGSAHVPHQARITSSSRKASRESRMQRNTREDTGIRGNVFDCQPARRVPKEIHNASRNLATPSGIQRREGIEKSGIEEQLQSTHFFSCSTHALIVAHHTAWLKNVLVRFTSST